MPAHSTKCERTYKWSFIEILKSSQASEVDCLLFLSQAREPAEWRTGERRLSPVLQSALAQFRLFGLPRSEKTKTSGQDRVKVLIRSTKLRNKRPSGP